MVIFMHVFYVYVLFFYVCDSPFSSVNSECSDQVSHDIVVDSIDDFVEEDDNSNEESHLEGIASTTKRRGKTLSAYLKSGKYPTFLGMHGPTQQVYPNDGSAPGLVVDAFASCFVTDTHCRELCLVGVRLQELSFPRYNNTNGVK